MHQITCSRDSEQMNSRSEKEREEKAKVWRVPSDNGKKGISDLLLDPIRHLRPKFQNLTSTKLRPQMFPKQRIKVFLSQQETPATIQGKRNKIIVKLIIFEKEIIPNSVF